CVDSEIPKWKDDKWYWSKEATDWGWDWASEKDKHLHPKYAPVNRYARDIIGCLNNWVDGWIDWNMVLDKKGGPNWFENWCVAPVIVDPDNDEVYFTPIYYTMSQFSRYIRPGAVVIGVQNTNKSIMVTSVKNPDNSIVVVLFNEEAKAKNFNLKLNNKSINLKIDGQAIQTVVIPSL
ncbi:glycoside hydrolase family 30 beta sandwich domain-containing protein, partial [Psychroserpens sp.]|uniref:glycoside hydrolase family 30 beta sandwich domain-containing protein n=1 Tax=Psychroserpens sp. TaxID=2020870 RepID=UPI00385CB17B